MVPWRWTVRYAEAVTAEIVNNPLIEVIREEITEIPDDAITVIASGPLTSDALAEKSMSLTVEMASISMMPLHQSLIKRLST